MDREALAGYSSWGRKESDTPEQLTHTHTQTKSRCKYQELGQQLNLSLA